jgi:uncharacterized protein (DUF2267 family)
MVMDQKELIRAIAVRTGLSRQESADLTRAVLEGLRSQLSEGEAKRLAAALPDSLLEQVKAPKRHGKEARPVGVDDFIRQLSERIWLKEDEARRGVGAVLAVLREALDEEEYRHLVGQLPAGYADLAAVS